MPKMFLVEPANSCIKSNNQNDLLNNSEYNVYSYMKYALVFNRQNLKYYGFYSIREALAFIAYKGAINGSG